MSTNTASKAPATPNDIIDEALPVGRRVRIAFSAAVEIAELGEHLLAQDVGDLPVPVFTLFVERLLTLSNGICSALGDQHDLPDDIENHLFDGTLAARRRVAAVRARQTGSGAA